MKDPSRRVPRWTIRTRLAVLYATVFLVAGGALLGMMYGLMRQAIFEQQTNIAVVSAPAPTASPTDAVTEMLRLQKLEGYRQALSEESRQATLNSMTRTLAIGLGVLVVAGFGLGWLVARRSLRPVQQITATARRVAGGNLSERIALRGPRDELRELAETFDDMVSRLEAAFDSQRRFVANASHELRTPLAIHRTLIEVAVARPDSPPELGQLGASLLQVNERQQLIIDGLLALAESERDLTTTTRVDLADVVRHTIRTLRPEAAEHAVTLTVSAEPAELIGDPVLVERLTVNLVQNAIRHNLAGGRAWVSCASTPEGVEFRVVNTGPIVPAARLEELFEPFRRGTSRRGPRGGSGLGLSIARAVAVAHGGGVSAVPRDGGGLVVVATLPRAPVYGSPASWVR